VGLQDRFVPATPAQTSALVTLEQFLRDPLTWSPPPGALLRPDPTAYVPTHLWVSWDRSVPDPSRLPSPAREVLTSVLRPVLAGSCEVISLAQAQRIERAAEQVGLAEPQDVTDGFAFDLPGRGGTSFLHVHPALPDEGTCH
jgi:hypothetical protein